MFTTAIPVRIALRSAVVAAILVACAVGALASVPQELAQGTLPPAQPIQASEIVNVDNVLTSEVQGLIASGACWDGDAPLDADGRQVVPSHVLMRVGAGDTTYSTDVARALDDIFKADDPAVTVTAFCR